MTVITHWRSSTAKLGKTYSLREDGGIDSGTKGDMFDGRVWVLEVPTAEALKSVVWDNATNKDLFTLGTPSGLSPEAGGLGVTTASRPSIGCVSRSANMMHFRNGPGWLMIDIDSKDAPADKAAQLATPQGVIAAVLSIIPELMECEFLLLPSSSNGLLRPDGTPAKTQGWHLFILIEDQRDVPQALHNLLGRAYLTGWGWPMVTGSGSIAPRGLVDLALAAVNQPIYPGAVATAAEPLRFAKPEPIVNRGRPLALPDVNKKAAEQAKRIFVDMASAPEVQEKSKTNARRSLDKRRQELRAKGMAEDQIDAKLAQQENHILHDSDLLTLNDGSTITVAEALDSPDRYHNVYMRDPLEPDYGRSRAVLKIKPRPDRPSEPPVLLSFAHGGAAGFDLPTMGTRPSKTFRFARYQVESKGVPLGMLLGLGIDNHPAPTLPQAQDQMAQAFRSFVGQVESLPPSITVNGDPVEGIRTRAAVYTATGLGKTEQILANAAKLVRIAREMADGGKTVVIAVPRHDLADEVAERLRSKLPSDISLAVYRGRKANAPHGEAKMCERHKEASAVESVGANVTQSLCQQKKLGQEVKLCPFFETCPYMRQMETEADIWIVPHALLGNRKPQCLGEVGVLFIDEDPLMSLIGSPEAEMSLDSISLPGGLLGLPPAVGECLRRVRDALRKVEAPMPTDRTFSRVWVPNARLLGLDPDDLRECYRVLIASFEQPEDLIQADEETVLAAVGRLAHRNTRLMHLCELLKALFRKRVDVSKEPEWCPYLERRKIWTKEAGLVEGVSVYSFRHLDHGWLDAHTMLLSATARSELMRHVWPSLMTEDELTVRKVEMPNVRVRQILNDSMARSKWSDKPNKQRRVWNYIRKRAAQYHKTLVVAQKELVGILREKFKQIKGVEYVHFNALSGIDSFKDVDLVISIGRVSPSIQDVERMAAVIGHCDIERLPEGKLYPLRKAFIPVKNTDLGVTFQRKQFDGGEVEYGVEHHPDPLCEAVRWSICVGELIQALGRGRGLRRRADNPLQLDILTTQDAGIPINECGTFEQFETTAFEQLVIAGLVPQDIEARGGAVLAAEVVRDLFDGDPAKIRDGRRNESNSPEYDTTAVDGTTPTQGLFHGFVEQGRHIHGIAWKEWSTCDIVLVRTERDLRVPCYVLARTFEEAQARAYEALGSASHAVQNFKPSSQLSGGVLADALKTLRAAGDHPMRQDKRSPDWAGGLLDLPADQAEAVLGDLVLKGYLVPCVVRDKKSRKMSSCYKLA